MTPSPAPRQRLSKGDEPLLVRLLEQRGFHVRTQRGSKVQAFDPHTNEYICGFTWRKGILGNPGCWSFDISMADIHVQHDLQVVLGEISRVTRRRADTRKAWADYSESRSAKRWTHYLSHLALLFAIRAPVQDKENP